MINCRAKGGRGHRKAIAWLLGNGFTHAEAWPHTRGNTDLFGLGDVIALKPDLVNKIIATYYIQVKHTKRKPSKADFTKFHQAIKHTGLDPFTCQFFWFADRVKEPKIWIGYIN